MAWQAVKQALHRRRVRIEAEGRVAPKAAQMLHYVIHISPDGRKACTGDFESTSAIGCHAQTCLLSRLQMLQAEQLSDLARALTGCMFGGRVLVKSYGST